MHLVHESWKAHFSLEWFHIYRKKMFRHTKRKLPCIMNWHFIYEKKVIRDRDHEHRKKSVYIDFINFGYIGNNYLQQKKKIFYARWRHKWQGALFELFDHLKIWIFERLEVHNVKPNHVWSLTIIFSDWKTPFNSTEFA